MWPGSLTGHRAGDRLAGRLIAKARRRERFRRQHDLPLARLKGSTNERDEVVDVALDDPGAVGSTTPHRPPIERRPATCGDELIPRSIPGLDHGLAKVTPPVTDPIAIDRVARLDLAWTREDITHPHQQRTRITGADHPHRLPFTLNH